MFSIVNLLTNNSILSQNSLGRLAPDLRKANVISRAEEVKLRVGVHP